MSIEGIRELGCFLCILKGKRPTTPINPKSRYLSWRVRFVKGDDRDNRLPRIKGVVIPPIIRFTV